jgi:transcriptional regulator NrdR family protein
MRVKKVQKNSGYIQTFSLAKLEHSIARALRHADIYDTERIKRITHEVKTYLDSQNKKLVTSDEIREAVFHIMEHDEPVKLVHSYELESLRSGESRITTVIKRSGFHEDFEPRKLFVAINNSFTDAGLIPGKRAEKLTKEIVAILESKTHETTIPVELIRETTKSILRKQGLINVERSYLSHKYI